MRVHRRKQPSRVAGGITHVRVLMAGALLLVASALGAAPVEAQANEEAAQAAELGSESAAPVNTDANLGADGDEAASPETDEGGVAEVEALDMEEGAGAALELQLDGGLSPLSLEPAADAHLELELALRQPTYDFDPVSFISASRSIITAVLETYCAAGLLLPGEEGVDTVEIVLGVGCLLGATTLYITGIRRLVRPVEQRRAVERLERFNALIARGALSDEERLELESGLRDAAKRDRRRRIFEIVFGAANLVATAVLAGLTARGRIDSVTGTSIASGTGVLGVMGMGVIWARSPSERAWSRYQAR